MISAVRATPQGLAALEEYVDGGAVYVNGSRLWAPNLTAETVLACAPLPTEWVMMKELIRRVEDAIDSLPANFNSAILDLERTGYLAIFRQLEADTPIQVCLSGWTFPTTYKHIAHQVTNNLLQINRELQWKGVAVVDGYNRMQLEIRLAQ